MRPDTSREAVRARREAVATLTRCGKSADDIAVMLGITGRSVVRIRSDLGIAQPAAKPMSPDEVMVAERLLADGASYSEVARTLGRSSRTLHEKFPGFGWPPGEGARFAVMHRWAEYRCRQVYAHV